MARTARTFAAIDVNYFEDARVLEVGDAWQLHFAAVLAAKRGTTNGLLTRRQLERAAPDSVTDFDGAYAACIDAGLFVEESEGITIRSWHRWNDAQEVIEQKSRAGVKANHDRWHTKKPSPTCSFCNGSEPDSESDPTRIQTASAAESKRREEKRREEKRREEKSREDSDPY